MPETGRPILIRFATSTSRPAARQESRTVLRQVLALWSGLAPEQLPLAESRRGPQWHGFLAGQSLDISLSYCEEEAWIGLIRGGVIGVDAMSIRTFAEAEAVARHYLDSETQATIRQSSQPAQTFALAWTKFEARLKCLKFELSEWNIDRVGAFANLACQEILLGSTAVTVATGK